MLKQNFLNIKCYFFLVLLASGFTFISCKNESSQPKVSFYYWKTFFFLSKKDKQLLEENQSDKLYIRYYDVVIKNNQPIPVGAVVGEVFPKKKQIVPVIFIKNEVFKKLNHSSIDTLVNRMVNFTRQINESRQVRSLEIQFDCDWTEKTKEPYFYFLKKYKNLSGQKLSTTIRLHQIKYLDKMGVPPVSKGVLMYYNMGIINANDENSIYNRNLATKYLAYIKDYPLPLEVALPIFSWGIQIRNNQVVALLNKVKNTDFQNKDTFQQIKKSFFKANKNFFKRGYYFQKNDIIKIEAISDKELMEMADDLSKNMKQPQEIIFYHLDSLNYDQYEKNIFKKIKHSFN